MNYVPRYSISELPPVDSVSDNDCFAVSLHGQFEGSEYQSRKVDYKSVVSKLVENLESLSVVNPSGNYDFTLSSAVTTVDSEEWKPTSIPNIEFVKTNILSAITDLSSKLYDDMENS